MNRRTHDPTTKNLLHVVGNAITDGDPGGGHMTHTNAASTGIDKFSSNIGAGHDPGGGNGNIGGVIDGQIDAEDSGQAAIDDIGGQSGLIKIGVLAQGMAASDATAMPLAA